MTTIPTIEEMNKAIAEFMGAESQEWYPKNILYPDQSGIHLSYPDKKFPDNEKYHSLGCLKYHSSWDWLMPVVEKIHAIRKEEAESITKDCISRYGGLITWTSKISEMSYEIDKALRTIKIEKVHQTVYEFTQWYNQSK